MPLMGSLYVGSSGLQVGQNALNATAHNLANKDSLGYTRQQSLLTSRNYTTISRNSRSVSNQQIGLGVQYSKVRQVRDSFLDKTYRNEIGRSAFYEVNTEALYEVHDLLGEMQGESFSEALDDMWTSIQELSKNPDAVAKGLLVHKASAFIERAGAVYDGLNDYQNNLNLQVAEQVKLINDYGQKLKALNDEIRKIESSGKESANDLRDARNYILDELSKLAQITYKEDMDGTVSVKLEGTDFVKRDGYYEMGLDVDKKTGFYTPFWTQNASYSYDEKGEKVYNATGANVFDSTRKIELGTDGGALQALLIARGDHRANYTDLNPATYERSGVSQSLVMNIQAEFDQMINIMTTKMNDIIRGAADTTTGYLCGSDGMPLELFTRIGTETYDANGNYIQPDVTKSETMYTTNNLRINAELLKTPELLSFYKPDGKFDKETLEKLKDAFEEKIYTLNPKVQTTCTFTDYYSSLVSQVANTGAQNENLFNYQASTVESADFARQQVAGVSEEEELSNMIKFQNAYNASSRYINVVNEMLEHLLTKLG